MRGRRLRRLRQHGLDVAEAVSLLRPVEVRTARVAERGGEAGSARSTFFLYAALFAAWAPR